MLLFAADTVRRRAPEVPGRVPPGPGQRSPRRASSLSWCSSGSASSRSSPRTLIPLAGMMVGNSMTATVVVARRVLEELRYERDEVEARLAVLGRSGG